MSEQELLAKIAQLGLKVDDLDKLVRQAVDLSAQHSHDDGSANPSPRNAATYGHGHTGAPIAHNELSATHTDSTAASATRGDIITAQGASPKWARLAKGASATVLRSDGTDPAWAALVAGDLPTSITGADYLVGTAQAGLSAEIVAGTAPGGHLGGTWASPTVTKFVLTALSNLGSPQALTLSTDEITLPTKGIVVISAQSGTLDDWQGTTTAGAEGDFFFFLTVHDITIIHNTGTAGRKILTPTGKNLLYSGALGQALGLLIYRNSAWNLVETMHEASLTFVIDGGGATITTGVKGDLIADFDCYIVGWTAVADQSGSIVVDVWKDTYANYPPTVADTIAGSEKPTISSATKGQDLTLTTWTQTVTKGDTIRFNVDSVTTCQRVTIALRVLKL